ncbi:MAG TPA: hypothetical protein VGP13_00540 [Candidatus Paceibacterota bacterium]|jgi:hypothetical protein|nr:hypothetical protein [Candidatus Paceibacterota bacterium]
MFRYVAIALALLSTDALAQQGAVLIEKPPVYQVGDEPPRVGKFINMQGGHQQMKQSVIRKSDGRVYLRTIVIDARGGEESEDLVDVETYQSTGTSDGSSYRTLEETCTPEYIFPVIERKQYSCTTRAILDGGEVRISTEMVYVGRRNSAGELVGVCESRRTKFKGFDIDSTLCYTPDLKWTLSRRLFPPTQSTDL